MKTKKGTDTAKAFAKILAKSRRVPEKLQTDKGVEFYNKNFNAVLCKHNIVLYSTESDKKAAIAERCIKEVKKLIYRYLSTYQTNRYIDQLQSIMDTYNSTLHSSIGMAPMQVNESNLEQVLKNLYGHLWASDYKHRPLFKVGDNVRISISRNLFTKGYKGFWTNEIFIVMLIKHLHPRTMYQLQDVDGEIVKGLFYEDELQKAQVGSKRFSKVSKILRKKFIRGQLWYLVTWENEPASMKRWIPANSLV
jgi:hypothetical protein